MPLGLGLGLEEDVRGREPDEVGEGIGVGVSEEVREGDKEGDSDPEEVLVGEGLGDTGLNETEKTGSPFAFVAISMGLVNRMSVVVFAGTVTPVDAKST